MSKRLNGRESCRCKAAYGSRASIIRALKNTPSTKGQLYPYRCHYDPDHWHLSSISQWSWTRRKRLNEAASGIANERRKKRVCRRCLVIHVRPARYCSSCAEHFMSIWYRSMGMLDAPID